MGHAFIPYKSFGPLTFGMSRDQIVAAVGAPARENSVWDLHGHLLDRSLYTAQRLSELRRMIIMSWPDSATGNQRPEVMTFDGKLVSIHLVHRSDSLVVNGVDLWAADRVRVILDLAQLEEVMLFSGADYYFETIGVRITAPRLWKGSGSIGLLSHEGFALEMDGAQPAEYHPDEITGRET